MIYEETGDKKYLDRVVKRWNDAVSQGFVFPTGGVCEQFYVEGHSDEGCSEADWLRLNLMIWKNTGDVKYLDSAERTLYNEYQMNQWHTGGFGHRYMISDKDGCFAWGKRYAESYWCCSYHGPLGYYEFKEYLAVGEENPEAKTPRVYYNFPLDFTSTIPFKTGAWKVESRQLEPKKNVPIVSKITFSGRRKATPSRRTSRDDMRSSTLKTVKSLSFPTAACPMPKTDVLAKSNWTTRSLFFATVLTSLRAKRTAATRFPTSN